MVYAVNVVTGIFSLMYVPSQVLVHGDALAKFNGIAASESLYRWGIVAGVICQATFLVLPLVLYRLFRAVNEGMAVLMAAFAVAAVPVGLVAIANQFDVLTVLHEASATQAFNADQVHARVLGALAAYDNRLLVAQVFWGLWLFPFGYLVFKSGFLPKILGVLLMLGCFSYLVSFFAGTLFPRYDLPDGIMLPAALGEFAAALWLLFAGARRSLFRRK